MSTVTKQELLAQLEVELKEFNERELKQLEKDARRPNYGSKYYPPSTVLALIDKLKNSLDGEWVAVDADVEGKE